MALITLAEPDEICGLTGVSPSAMDGLTGLVPQTHGAAPDRIEGTNSWLLQEPDELV